MEFFLVWGMIALGLAFIALNMWLVMDYAYDRLTQALAARSPKAKTVKASGLSPISS